MVLIGWSFLTLLLWKLQKKKKKQTSKKTYGPIGTEHYKNVCRVLYKKKNRYFVMIRKNMVPDVCISCFWLAESPGVKHGHDGHFMFLIGWNFKYFYSDILCTPYMYMFKRFFFILGQIVYVLYNDSSLCFDTTMKNGRYWQCSFLLDWSFKFKFK